MSCISKLYRNCCPENLSRPVLGTTITGIGVGISLVAFSAFIALALHQALPQGVNSLVEIPSSPELLAGVYLAGGIGLLSILASSLVIYGAWKNGNAEKNPVKRFLNNYSSSPMSLIHAPEVGTYATKPETFEPQHLYIVPFKDESEEGAYLYAETLKKNRSRKVKIHYLAESANQNRSKAAYSYCLVPGIRIESPNFGQIIENFSNYFYGFEELMLEDGQQTWHRFSTHIEF